jgi:hypothetical protein
VLHDACNQFLFGCADIELFRLANPCFVEIEDESRLGYHGGTWLLELENDFPVLVSDDADTVLLPQSMSWFAIQRFKAVHHIKKWLVPAGSRPLKLELAILGQRIGWIDKCDHSQLGRVEIGTIGFVSRLQLN